eukprot:scaffold85561_cov19-Tisochrysis_lutea.AAC.1
MQSQLKQRQCPARALRWSELEGHSRDGVQQHECDGPNRCSLAFVPLNIPKREESDATAVKHFLSSSQVDAFSWIAERLEWWTLWWLAKDEKGLVRENKIMIKQCFCTLAGGC